MVEGVKNPRRPLEPEPPDHARRASVLTSADLDPGVRPDERQWSFPVPVTALVFLVRLAALYRGILRDLAWQWWDDPNYTHGFLVPLFSGLRVWQRRKQLAALPPKGSWIGFLVLVAGVGALLLGDVGAENFLMRSSLIVVLAGLVLVHLGRDIFRVLAFPLLFLFFMVPLPATVFYSVAFPLQNLAARIAAWTLDLVGVPVVLDGNLIHLTRLSLGVAEACSGIRLFRPGHT